MLQLLLDTATEKAFIGLASGGVLIEFVQLPVGLQNSKYFFPNLLDLLSRNGLTPNDVGLIGCGVGPGSYTGIRVGAAVAQSMAYALRLPLVGLCSLKGYVPSKPGLFAAALDARVGGVYLIKGEFDGQAVLFDEMPKVVSVEEIASELKDTKILVTPHILELREKIGAFLPYIEWEEGNPSGEIFAMQVDDSYKKNNYSKKAELKLLYLRKTQAEIEKNLGIKGSIS